MMMMIPITLHDSIKPAGVVSRGVAEFASGFASARPIGLATLALSTAHPPNWIQTNSVTKQETKRKSCTRLKFSITVEP